MSTPAAPVGPPRLGVIGGSGLYRFLTSAREVPVDTPFGPPSDPVVVGELAGRAVAFVPRHGVDHRFPPHLVNYRANLWALRSVGVRQVLAPCAVGSLRPDLTPGTLVVPDQLVDRTWGRGHTFSDTVGPVVHVAFADPYCPRGRAAVLEAARSGCDGASGVATGEHGAHDGGTLVVVNGPRFSTRAESRLHAALGCDLVGMTALPEAALARELALCYTNLAIVTDLDAGLEAGEGVSHDEVLRVFAGAVERVRGVLTAAVAALDPEADCACRHSLDGMSLPYELP